MDADAMWIEFWGSLGTVETCFVGVLGEDVGARRLAEDGAGELET